MSAEWRDGEVSGRRVWRRGGEDGGEESGEWVGGVGREVSERGEVRAGGGVEVCENECVVMIRGGREEMGVRSGRRGGGAVRGDEFTQEASEMRLFDAYGVIPRDK